MYKIDKVVFISVAYDDIRRKCADDIPGKPADALFADSVRGLPLIPHLHTRDTISNVRAVTLRIKGQPTDYGVPAVFEDPLAALTFYNAVRCTLKKMDPPIL